MVAAAPAPRPLPLRDRLGAALATTLACLPALVAAWLVLRIGETVHAGQAGLQVSVLLGPALANDLLALLRHACLLLLGAVPVALLPSRWRPVALGAGWSILLVAHAGLVDYQWTAGVPLGADLFAYSQDEIATTVGGRVGIAWGLGLALASALAVLWVLLLQAVRPWWPRGRARPALLLAGASVLAFVFLPDRFMPAGAVSETAGDYLRNKTAYFVDRSLAYLARAAGLGAAVQAQPPGGAPWAGKDPAHPFLHPDRTPDTLGPLLNRGSGLPNLVFIVVEGLGRDFSGPGARLGSFTPFLDALAGKSLYFENFLAAQGRTFGVLPSVFGSLPFGEEGLAAMAPRMPRHASLLSVLKEQGYRLDYYTGTNPAFDNQGAYLRAEGVDHLFGEADFGAGRARSGYWGYADGDLLDEVLARQQADAAAPTLGIIQTVTMHDPFVFPDKAAWLDKVDARLRQLGIDPASNPAYANRREIFASVLYTDDALRRYFERAARLPGYDRTVFFITGDHRLPELPMDTRIERYHVPLIVASPLLKGARSIKAVSSQLDIAPSVLSWLAHDYGLRTPSAVTWLGTGLDTAPAFRNLHAVPLKQTKTELSDFVSGTVYLAQDRLYALADGMRLDRTTDEAALVRARAQFQAFLAANRQAGRAAELAPAPARRLAGYRADGRDLRTVALASEAGRLSVDGLRRGAGGGDGVVVLEARVHNDGSGTSPVFVPLLAISDVHGAELMEVPLAARTLGPGEGAGVAFTVRLGKLPHGTYFVSMLPSHPDTARPVGIGQYHVRMDL